MAEGGDRADPYVLRAEGIGRSFGGREVLRGASLWAAPGEVTTLLRRNGCGKTTLMRVAAGHLAPHQGTVIYRGRPRPRARLGRLAREGVMYVPQDGMLSPAYTLGEHLRAFVGAFAGLDVAEAVERTGVADLLDRAVPTLSGGERMRASFALARARRPVVLLVDEPLAELAPLDRERVGTALREMAQSGCAVVTSGHDARELLELSDHVIWCTSGTTHGLGSPAQALDHEQFRREYLGPGFS